jgi:hypothetical protein
MASTDPEFEEKAADIIGLYLKSPLNAAVFCVDEKSAIQALDRLDPVLPLSPGRAERHGFEYYRHGTVSLYAALHTGSGKVRGTVWKRFSGTYAKLSRLLPPNTTSSFSVRSSTPPDTGLHRTGTYPEGSAAWRRHYLHHAQSLRCISFRTGVTI